jgi:uncharacterized protein (DUF1501 family)
MKTTRRRFLSTSSAISMAGAVSPFAANLAGIGEAAAQSAGDDYKAIVCVFLNGGNDNHNTLVPFDAASYARYQAQRGDLAYQKNALAIGSGSGTPIVAKSGAAMTGIKTLAELVLNPTVALPGGRQFALAPALTALLPKFDAGRLAVLQNVGTLKRPTVKADYTARNQLPPRLFSHNDQTSYWQSSGVEGSSVGWGGQFGDKLNADAQQRNDIPTFSCVSVAGNALLLTGKETFQYQVTTTGPVPFDPLRNALYGSGTVADALGRIVTGTGSGLFEQEHTSVMSRAIDASDVLNDKLRPAADVVPASNPKYAALLDANNQLGRQLAMVARLIDARKSIGARRQVFYVSIGEFDLHSDLAEKHSYLLRWVADSMAAFYDWTEANGVSTQVTTFTASEFGRTLASNGGGSDHGWGSTHFVLGGAVRGKAFYGTAPDLQAGSLDDVGSGRLIPTTSVDQVAGTLARWMGVTDTQALQVLPNLGNFPLASRNLGFV